MWRAISLVLAVALMGMVYLYVTGAKVETSADGRTSVNLNPDERDLVLIGMRGMLETVQIIVEATGEGNMQAVSAAASANGLAKGRRESAALIGSLPVDFMALGMDTHSSFDNLAKTAQATDDPAVVMAELGDLLNQCTTCHAGYRLEIAGTSE